MQPFALLTAVAAVLLMTPMPSSQPSSSIQAPTTEEARAFIEEAEKRLDELGVKLNRAQWVQETYITEDTEILAAEAQEAYTAAVTELALAAQRFEAAPIADEVLSRKLRLLKLALVAPAPNDPVEREELTRITSSLTSEYGKGRYCRSRESKEQCLDINDLSRIMAESRDPGELLDLWVGWHRVGTPMRQRYERFVELSNKGARELGFADTGAMWRSNYDLPPDAFSAELDRLWRQVQPLYLSLHTYVRRRLQEHYRDVQFPPDGTLPAHLLGNMWAQTWANVYPLVAPPTTDRGYDLTAILKARQVDERELVRYAERFFTSLGFEPLPKTFWERSLFKKPQDREVVCHASAWDIDARDDLRLKMCTEIRDEDFVVVHHELGHNFYQRAYKDQPPLFQAGANDGFHEAIGDAIALSTTPGYLKQIGLLEKVPSADADLGYLLKMALDKVAFLPFGLLIDQWRWKVFSGEVPSSQYNEAWWDLRRTYQGVSPPVPRSKEDFDPGAKYHVPANTPYARYFIAHILQFQFHRALCREAGYTGPIHGCSIYGNTQAGRRLAKMLEMGASRPWPEALEALTGETRMDATAILDYFAPLQKWLEDQNRGAKQGWSP
jgi:peptidyl-dipeptidase A